MFIQKKDLVRISLLFEISIFIYLLDIKFVYCWYLLLLSLFLLFLARKHVILFISALLVAYCNYSIVVLRYFFPKSLIINNSLQQYDLISIKIMVFFMCFLIGFMLLKNSRYKDIYSDDNLEKKSSFGNRLYSQTGNSLIVVINIIALVLIWFLLFDFNLGEKSGYSPLYEYSVVFFILGLYYSKNKTIGKKIIIAIALFYVLFDFLGGQRSTGVQILIVIGIMCFYKYLTVKRIILASVIGLILVTMVGIFRGSFSMGSISFESIIAYLRGGAFGYSTAGFAYYTSLTFIGTMEYYSVFDRIIQFIQFLASQMIVGTIGKPITELASEHFIHYYGGVLPIYLYYYLGWLGTAISAFIVSVYYTIIKKIQEQRGLLVVVGVYIVATTHRWYLYSPNQLLRGVFLLSLMYCLYYYLDLYSKR